MEIRDKIGSFFVKFGMWFPLKMMPMRRWFIGLGLFIINYHKADAQGVWYTGDPFTRNHGGPYRGSERRNLANERRVARIDREHRKWLSTQTPPPDPR